MTIKASTGLRNKLLDTSPLRTLFNLGSIKWYSGTPPDTADMAPTGTLLNTITNNSTGTGITFEAAAASGEIAKKASETWSGVCGSSGTVGYYRLVGSADTGALSTTEPRIQGSVGLAGADLNLPVVAITSTNTYSIDNYAVGLPTL